VPEVAPKACLKASFATKGKTSTDKGGVYSTVQPKEGKGERETPAQRGRETPAVFFTATKNLRGPLFSRERSPPKARAKLSKRKRENRGLVEAGVY